MCPACDKIRGQSIYTMADRLMTVRDPDLLLNLSIRGIVHRDDADMRTCGVVNATLLTDNSSQTGAIKSPLSVVTKHMEAPFIRHMAARIFQA